MYIYSYTYRNIRKGYGEYSRPNQTTQRSLANKEITKKSSRASVTTDFAAGRRAPPPNKSPEELNESSHRDPGSATAQRL